MVNFRIDVIVDPRRATQGAKQVEKGLDNVDRKASTLSTTIKRTFAGIGVGLLVRKIASVSDSYTALQNRLRLVTEGQQNLSDVTQELFASADRTRTSFTGTAELYARVALSAKELGRSQSELLAFTESVNQTIKLSGATAAESSAGLIQFAQGLASGALRGDELRSVLEQLPAVADVISKELGVTRGELREMGKQGAITADIVLDAFKNARSELADRFATTVPTIGEAFAVLGNKVTKSIGAFNEATGAAEGLSRGLILVAENADTLLTITTTLATAIGIRLAVNAIPAAVAALTGLSAATIAAGGAFTVAAAAVVVASQRLTEFNRNAAAIGETLKGIEKDSEAVSRAGQLITNAQREINAIQRAIEAQSSRGGAATEGQLQRIERLRQSIARLKGEVKDEAAEQGKATSLRKAAAAAAEEHTEAEERRAKLLASLRKPQQDFNNLQSDLNILLNKGKISQEEFAAALEKGRKALGGGEDSAPKDPFKEQLQSLRELNEELTIKAENSGVGEAVLLAELKLRREGVELTAAQREELRESIEAQHELTGVLEAQSNIKPVESGLTQREKDLASLIDVNAQYIEQEERLANILRERPELTEEVSAALLDLKIQALDASTSLGDGFERAFLKMKQEAEDFASVSESVMNSFADNATNALTEFAETGKFNFRGFAESLLKDITRIIARLLIVKALSAIGGAAGAGGAAASGAANAASGLGQGARARGGPVQPGQRITVGENGPEEVQFDRTATVFPNTDKAAPAEKPNVNLQVNNVLDSKQIVAGTFDNGDVDESFLNMLSRVSAKANRVLQNQ